MALKSSREGLRKELVDYLGNIIIDNNLKQNIINSVDDVFINNEELLTAINEVDEKIRNETLARELADSNLESNKANKSDVLSFEEIQASTDLTGKIASASALKMLSDKNNLFMSETYTVNKTLNGDESSNIDLRNIRIQDCIVGFAITRGSPHIRNLTLGAYGPGNYYFLGFINSSSKSVTFDFDVTIYYI